MPAARLISASSLFDPVWYGRDGSIFGPRLARALHYVLRGAAEGRSPCAAFDGDWYLRRHPEIALPGLNPLLHYLQHGQAAGLAIRAAAESAMPRQILTERSYRAWAGELARLSTQAMARSRARIPNLTRVALRKEGAPDHKDDADYLLFLPKGVDLSETALLEIAAFIAHAPAAELIYADEDVRPRRHITASARRQRCRFKQRLRATGLPGAPWFKPDWDPELMRAGDLTGPATVFHRALLRRLGWDGAAPDLAGLRALSLRATGSGCSVGHIPKILFHRRAMPGQRLSRVKPAMPADRPMVSVIIPTRDRADLLRVVTQGVLARTDYPSLELLIVDNDSREADTHDLLTRLSADARVKVLPAPGAFNWSVMNNQAARSARGDVLVLLNNDIDIVAPEWLSELVAEAMRPEIGIAGAKLIYPDGTLQHGGMTIGADGFFAHAMRHAPGGDSGCVGEMAVTRSVASVTGACLAIRRDLFLAVGGLDEDQLGFTHNDIDLCLRLRHAGYRVVYTPAAVLVHHETATRGLDMSEAQLMRVRTEWLCLRARWGALATTDPYLNRNLTLLRDRFALQSPALLIETHENA